MPQSESDRATAKAENFAIRARLRGLLSPAMKERVGKLILHPAAGRAIGSFYGNRLRSGPYRVRTDAAMVSPHTKAQIFWGVYESAEIRMIHQHLRRDLDLLEVGSSLGVVSCHAVGRLRDDAKAVCIEANPALHPTLRGNLADNHPQRRVTVLNVAVDYENAGGTTQLQVAQDTAGSQLGRLDEGAATDSLVEVPATTLSALVGEHELGDFALISDIEGAEVGFIFSDASELAGCKQMLIELHDSEYQGRRLSWQNLLEEIQGRHGFRVTDHYGPVHVLDR